MGATGGVAQPSFSGFTVAWDLDIDDAELLATLYYLWKTRLSCEREYGAKPPTLEPWAVGNMTDSESCFDDVERAWREPSTEWLTNTKHANLLDSINEERKTLSLLYNCSFVQMRVPGHGGLIPMMMADAMAKSMLYARCRCRSCSNCWSWLRILERIWSES